MSIFYVMSRSVFMVIVQKKENVFVILDGHHTIVIKGLLVSSLHKYKILINNHYKSRIIEYIQVNLQFFTFSMLIESRHLSKHS